MKVESLDLLQSKLLLYMSGSYEIVKGCVHACMHATGPYICPHSLLVGSIYPGYPVVVLLTGHGIDNTVIYMCCVILL